MDETHDRLMLKSGPKTIKEINCMYNGNKKGAVIVHGIIEK